MLVFQAVISVGTGDRRTCRYLAGDVTPYNLEALYASALEQVTDQHEPSCLREVTVTLTGTHKESILPEVGRRLQRLEAYGVKVIVA